jgi:hypothetical protein
MKVRPKIEIIRNQAQLVQLGVLQAETASWLVGLTSARFAPTRTGTEEPVNEDE